MLISPAVTKVFHRKTQRRREFPTMEDEGQGSHMAAIEPREERVWQMHMGGMAPSQIVGELGCTEDEARSAVTARWAEDRRENRRARA